MKSGTYTSILVSLALSACAVPRGDLPVPEFGVVQFGASWKPLLRLAKRDEDFSCEIYQGEYADCGFVDDRGVNYTAWDKYVTRKRIDLEPGKAHPPLPYGLSGDETPADVERLMREKYGAEFERSRGSSGEILLASRQRGRGAGGTPFWLYFMFDSTDRLIAIDIQGEATV